MKKVTIGIFLLILFPISVSAGFFQPSFTGYFNISSKDNYSNSYDPPLAGAFFQKLTLPDQSIEDIYGVTVKMSAQDLGMDPDCKLIPHVHLVVAGYGYLTFTPTGYTFSYPYTTDGEYYIGGSNFAGDPKNLVGHDVDVLFNNKQAYYGPKISNLNQITGIVFGGLMADNLHNPANCTFTVDWSHNWSNAVLMVGHGEDVFPNNDLKYLTTNNETTTTPEDLTFSLQTKKAYTGKTPVLIVPGVLGTDMYKGEELYWANPKMSFRTDTFMDPLSLDADLKPIESGIMTGDVIRDKSVAIFHSEYIQGLIQEFIRPGLGYSEGKDLFTFPYDWRYGMSGKDENGSTTMEHLKDQIDYILNQTEAGKSVGKVDVIAHSTGGLLIKQYLQSYPNNHRIDRAVFVGVPNLGAPKALKLLLSGDNMDVPLLNPNQMKKISQNMPVVYDLAPTQEYYNKKGSYFHISNYDSSAQLQKIDLNYYEVYSYFINHKMLNSLAVAKATSTHSSELDNFDMRNLGADLYNIVGCKSATFSGVTEKNTLYTKEFDYPTVTAGDKTVPFVSADSLLVDEKKTFFAPKIGHGDLLSADGSRQLIVNLLAGSTLDTKGKILTRAEVKNKPELCEIKGERLEVRSPVNIDVTDNLGNHAGILTDGSLENNIPGADFEIWGEHKYVFLPTDESQNYSITLQGTGNGTFSFIDKKQSGDNISSGQVFANIPVTPSLKGTVEITAEGTYLKLDLDGDGTIDKVLEPDALLNEDQIKDLTPPISTSTITGNLKTSVSVNLSAVDPVISGHENETSGVLRTYYSLNNSSYLTYASPISLTEAGNYALLFYSIDKAGNKEEPQTVKISVSREKTDSSSSGSGGGGGGGCVDCQPPRDVSLKFLKHENGKSYFTLAAQDESLPLMMQVSESKDFPKAVWQKFNSNIEWTFSTSSLKTLYARVRDSFSNTSNVVSAVATSIDNAPIGEVLGESTSVLPAHPTGSLIIDGTGTVYIIENNIKRPFISAERFFQLNYQFNQVQFPWPGDASLLLGMPI